MITQLAKMLFLATFFPVSADEEDDPNLEVPFDFITVKKKITSQKSRETVLIQRGISRLMCNSNLISSYRNF